MEAVMTMDETKLKMLEAQKQEIEKFIISDPTNQQYLKMRDDLDTLIAMTTQIVSAMKNSSSNSNSNSGTVNGNDSAAEGHRGDANTADDGSGDDVSDLDSDDEEDTGVPQIPNNSPFAVGNIIEVVGSDRPYPGRITGVLGDGNFRVKYYEFDAEVTLPGSNLAHIKRSLVKPSEVEVGFKGQCIYPVDQLYYDAQVTSITEHGVVVTFTQYGNSCEVPINYLKPLQQKMKKAADPHALVKIPENLKILPTDTEEVFRRVISLYGGVYCACDDHRKG
jgi:hypothetical protein